MRGLISRYLRIPRPTRFLAVMSLRTGVEMIALSLLFNKLTGFYGLLAILTGLRLSPLQLSMYIYSCLALVLVTLLIPHIRKQSPFQCLVFAYFYAIDTLVNTAFTGAFAVTWFLAVSRGSSLPKSATGSGTMYDAAGFTNPEYNVSIVETIATPAHDISTSQEAAAYVVAAAISSSGSLEETIPSVALVAGLTLIRIYFILVILAYVRQVVRQYAFSTSPSKLHMHMDGCADSVHGENPFAAGESGGAGWQGRVGRVMVNIGHGYWLGARTAANEAWARGLDGRFRTSKISTGPPPGTIERERRARSGTGPPVPAPNLKL